MNCTLCKWLSCMIIVKMQIWLMSHLLNGVSRLGQTTGSKLCPMINYTVLKSEQYWVISIYTRN